MAGERLRILFAGSGAFGLPSLRAMLAAGHEVVRVYSQPDRPAGRGLKLTPTPVSDFAIKEGLKLTRTESLNREPLEACDVLVVIAFGQKISQEVANHPKYGAVNLHGSRLPGFRGAAPVQRAVMSGEPVTGNSIIRLAEKMDAGKVLGMSTVKIEPGETAGQLHDKLAEDGAGLLLRVLSELASGTAREVEQDHALATHAAKLSRADGVIDFSRPARLVAAQICGCSPWPGCRVRLVGADGAWTSGDLTLHSAAYCEKPVAMGGPGEFVSDVASGKLWMGCGDGGEGVVEILSLQPAGGKMMPVRSFLHGKSMPISGKVMSIT